MFDEIQTGMGRTGTLWAYEQTGVVPDALTSAKALGGGLPIGALVTGRAARRRVRSPGDHGSTFAGGPVVASAALVALEICSDPELLGRVRELGERLRAGLAELPYVRSVRGRGLMVAIDCAPRSPRPSSRAARCSSSGWSSTPRGRRRSASSRRWSSPSRRSTMRWRGSQRAGGTREQLRVPAAGRA